MEQTITLAIDGPMMKKLEEEVRQENVQCMEALHLVNSSFNILKAKI